MKLNEKCLKDLNTHYYAESFTETDRSRTQWLAHTGASVRMILNNTIYSNFTKFEYNCGHTGDAKFVVVILTSIPVTAAMLRSLGLT